MKFSATVRSSKTLRRIVCRSFAWLILALLASTLVAQTDQKANREEAERLYEEAQRLIKVQTPDSIAEALRNLDQALPLFQSLKDAASDPDLVYKIGSIYFFRNAKQQAIDHWVSALALYRAAGDRKGEIEIITNLGWLYYLSGDLQKALDYYEQEERLGRAAGLKVDPNLLSILGHINESLGAKEKALEYYSESLRLSRAIGDQRGEASQLGTIGGIYFSVGESQKALEYYLQALPISRAVGDRLGQGTILIAIGGTYNKLGEKQKALDYYAQALQLYAADRTMFARQREAYTLIGMGWVYWSLGDLRKALDHFERALTIDFDPRSKGDALTGIGIVYMFEGEEQKAIDHLTQALAVSRATGERRAEADNLFNIAVVERNRENFDEGRKQIEAALVIVESFRTKITNQELRSSYFATVQSFYEVYIDLLMLSHKQRPSEGHDRTALHVSERARARALLETLAEANADIRQGVDPALLERERILQQRLNEKAAAQTKLLDRPHRDDQAIAIAKEIESVTTEFQQVEAQIRKTSPRYAALTQPQPLTLKEIQTNVLDEDTILLEYSLGDHRSYLWAVTPTLITSYELPKRSEIEAAARQVYELLTDDEKWSPVDSLAPLRAGKKTQRPKTTPRPSAKGEQARAVASPEAATRLSQMLLAPVAAQLANKRLLIVADGALQYIPFGALPSPTGSASKYQPLIIEHEIVALPSASTLAILRQETKDRKPAAKTVAVLADPVFESNDERVRSENKKTANNSTGTRPKKRELPLGLERAAAESGLRNADSQIPRLPGTRTEAKQILALVPAGDSKQALDFAANRQTATSAELSQYRYVHFATHGFLNSVHPELSGIVLSMVDEKGDPQDGFLRAHEVFNLKLPAELVVLSACQTGLGTEVKGEGLVGLTRGFMYAGAPRVVVSLWSVDDDATAALMTRFYRGMLREKLRPAAALRAAQVSLMKEKKWQSPFFWSAFTLQGEWR